MTTQNNDAELTVTVLQSTDSLLIMSYEIRNRGSQSLYVFNKLYKDISPDLVLQTDKNLVNIITQYNQVFMSKAIADVPENMRVEYTVKPCVTKVLPYEQIGETLSLQLPLACQTPYTDFDITDQIVSRMLFFSIGYFVGHDLTASYETVVKTLDGPAISFNPFSFQDQKLLTVGPFSQLVPVFDPK